MNPPRKISQTRPVTPRTTPAPPPQPAPRGFGRVPAPEVDGAERVLVLVDADNDDASRELIDALTRRAYAAAVVTSSADAAIALSTSPVKLVVIVLPLRDEGGREAIERIKAAAGGIPFMVIGADDDMTPAGEAFELGAQEHLLGATLDTSEFLAAVGVLLGSRRGDRHLQYLRSKDAPGTWRASSATHQRSSES